MSELESVLRRAMADDTAGLAIAPDLVDRVVRRSVRRRRTRLRLLAVVAAVLVVAGAVPAYVALVPRHQVTAGETLAEIDGVEVGYLPEGFGGPPERIRVKAGPLAGEALRWKGDGGFVQVGVYRTGRSLEDALDLLALNLGPVASEPVKRTGPVVFTATDEMWVPEPGLALRVTTSASLESELGRIAEGLRVVRNRDVGGMRVTYVPSGLRAAGKARINLGGIARSWTNGTNDTQGVTVEVVHGREALDLDSLRQVPWPTNEELFDVRRVSVGPAAALQGSVASAGRRVDRGRMLLWVVRPGVGVRIWATTPLAGELRRIAEGVEEVAADAAVTVDGIGVPASLGEPSGGDSAMGREWSGITRFWGGRPGEGPYVAVSVYRGLEVEVDGWFRQISSATPRGASVGDVNGTLLTWKERPRDGAGPLAGRTFLWHPEVGLVLAVTVVAGPDDSARAVDDLADLVRNLRVP
ncbi:hypothetical protein AB0O28_18185 [Microbispora sp. NPDC088329]|uniref:hypothetical protein n=1 Tax=Microbispora sp. NPDC088329 TaxID=3154869 RepID=UPI003419F7B9